MKINAYDYKSKWFVLMDSDKEDDFDFARPDINVDWAMGEGLKDHVENCLYYGIPAYLGADQELHDRIKKIEEGLIVD